MDDGADLVSALADRDLIGATSSSLLFALILSRSRRQLDACPSRFRQTNRDRLFGRPHAVLSFTYVMHLFSHELTGLRAGSFALPTITASPFNGLRFRHNPRGQALVLRAT